MTLQKEFYFIRHGQTDHNLPEAAQRANLPIDIALNATGRRQAKAIEPFIATLPIKTICVSPMKRAKETHQIITAKLDVPFHEVEHLGECSGELWHEMVKWGMYSPLPPEGEIRSFMERVRSGINHVLTLPGPLLIVAHGGVHWALSCLMGIQNHPWAIDNCAVVHFSIDNDNQWSAKLLK